MIILYLHSGIASIEQTRQKVTNFEQVTKCLSTFLARSFFHQSRHASQQSFDPYDFYIFYGFSHQELVISIMSLSNKSEKLNLVENKHTTDVTMAGPWAFYKL